MLHMISEVWHSVWNEFVNFTRNPGTESSGVLVEAYSAGKGREIPDDTSAFANRQITFNAPRIPWYADESLEPIAG